MKRIAVESKPVVAVPAVVEPIEVGLALRAIEPDIRDVLIALARNMPNATRATALRSLITISGLYFIRDLKSLSAWHRVSSFLEIPMNALAEALAAATLIHQTPEFGRPEP